MSITAILQTVETYLFGLRLSHYVDHCYSTNSGNLSFWFTFVSLCRSLLFYKQWKLIFLVYVCLIRSITAILQTVETYLFGLRLSHYVDHCYSTNSGNLSFWFTFVSLCRSLLFYKQWKLIFLVYVCLIMSITAILQTVETYLFGLRLSHYVDHCYSTNSGNLSFWFTLLFI